MSRLSKWLVAGGIVLVGTAVGEARAGFVNVLEDGTSDIPNGVFVYQVDFNTQIDTGSGSPVEVATPGDFTTMYDLPGLISATLNPAYAAQFTLTTQISGVTPANVLPTDGPLTNVTLTYIGATLTSSQQYVDALTIVSAFTAINPQGQFTAQSTKGFGLDAGMKIGSIGSVSIPRSVPEPAALALLLIGGVAVGLRARTRQRSVVLR